MELTNDGGFPGILARAQLLYRDLMMATVVVKASFEVAEDGVARPVAAEAQLPVSEEDVETDVGTIDSDVVPVKEMCDVAILGHARSPRADQPVDRQLLELHIGAFRRQLMVFGDRAWVESGRNPRLTAPAPFISVPLTYARAFGGSALVVKQLKAPYPQNPAGRGYVQLRENVSGTLLPNLEEADQLLTSWSQTPLAAGTAPLPRDSSLRLEGGGFGTDLRNELVQLTPAAFSFAHPRMRLDAYRGGELLTLTGATHGGPWTFQLPNLLLSAVLTLGEARHELPLVVDTLCLFPDYRRFFLLARRACVYQILPERLRQLSIVPSTGVGTAVTTIREQRASHAPIVPIGPAAAPEAMPLPFDALLSLYPLTNIVEALPLCPSG